MQLVIGYKQVTSFMILMTSHHSRIAQIVPKPPFSTMRDLCNRAIVAGVDVKTIWIVIHTHHIALLDDPGLLG